MNLIEDYEYIKLYDHKCSKTHLIWAITTEYQANCSKKCTFKL